MQKMKNLHKIEKKVAKFWVQKFAVYFFHALIIFYIEILES